MRKTIAAQIDESFADITRLYNHSSLQTARVSENYISVMSFSNQIKNQVKSLSMLSRLSANAAENDGFSQFSIESFLFDEDYALDEDKLFAFLENRRPSALFIRLLPYIICAAAIVEIGRICGLIISGSGYSEERLANAVAAMKGAFDIDIERFFVLSPLENLLQANEIAYAESSQPTRDYYKYQIATYAVKHNICEDEAYERLVKQYGSCGKYIYRRQNPYPYGFIFAVVFILLSIISYLEFKLYFLLLLPTFCVSGLLISDLVCSKIFKAKPLPALEIKRVSRDNSTLAVITSLLTDNDQIIKNIESFYLKNKDENIFFGLLLDFNEAKTASEESDEKYLQNAITAVQALNRKYNEKFALFVRSREYCKADRVYRAPERKRGAVNALVKLIVRDNCNEFSTVVCGFNIKQIKYLLTLDSDTNLPADGVKTLLGGITHPLNTGFVISPITEPSIIAATATRFSSISSGNAGNALYEQNAFSRYSLLFGNGVFCGKGLFDVSEFASRVIPSIPDRKILSHDIPEGAILGELQSQTIFTDSAPTNVVGWLKRLERWVRGDTQNLCFLGSKKIPFSGKIKLVINMINHLSYIFAIVFLLLSAFLTDNNITAVPFALSPLLISFIWGLAAFIKTALSMKTDIYYYRQKKLLLQVFRELTFSFTVFFAVAITSAAAVSRSVFRMITKKKLLQWITFSQTEKSTKGTVFYFIFYLFPVSVLGFLFIMSFKPIYICMGVVIFFYPLLASEQSKPFHKNQQLHEKSKQILIGYAKQIWSYFEDTVNEKSAFLPIDNIQFTPVKTTAYRTSPTNIGLYLVCVTAAVDFGFITADEAAIRLETAVRSIERLPKYMGNLYNWYALPSRAVLDNGYISSVDSGNFLVCLTCVKKYLLDNNLTELSERVVKIINETDRNILFNKRKKLFKIGVHANNGEEKSHAHYDLMMSESRLGSYHAIATGAVGVSHWKSLSRASFVKSGRVGMASWSGTAFEYFMAALFLPTYNGTYFMESLQNALYLQKREKTHGVYGISESAYFGFDHVLNYQYKAFGVPDTALEYYKKTPRVISPYSTFLMLPFDVMPSMYNLRRLFLLGAEGKYGFCEAIDFDDGGIVDAFFSHHLGMSMLALSNLLFDNINIRRFMADEHMSAYSELLCERTPDVIPFPREPRREEMSHSFNQAAHKSICKTEDILKPKPALLSSHGLTAIAFDNGYINLRKGQHLINGGSIAGNTADIFSLEGSIKITFSDGEHEHGISPLYAENAQVSHSFCKDSDMFSYICASELFSFSVSCSIDDQRDAFIFNMKGESKKALRASVSFAPILERARVFFSHPQYSRLFVECEYDEQNKLLTVNRRNSKFAVTVGFINEQLDFLRSESHDGSSAAVPINPYITIETVYMTDFNQQFFITTGDCAAQSKKNALSLRQKKGRRAICAKTNFALGEILSAIYYPARKSIYSSLPVNTLWKLGISGDYPIVLLHFGGEGETLLKAYFAAFKTLAGANIRMEMIIIFEESDHYARFLENKIKAMAASNGLSAFCGLRGGIFLFPTGYICENDLLYIKSRAVFETRICLNRKTEKPITGMTVPQYISKKSHEKKMLSADGIPCGHGVLSGDDFISDPQNGTAYSYVLSNRVFGTVLSDRSLGYSFVSNARLCRLTAFVNNPYADFGGEKLFAFIGGKTVDLCASADSCVFSIGGAVYHGDAFGVKYTVSVYLSDKFPVKFIKFEAEKSMRVAFVVKPCDDNGLSTLSRVNYLFRGDYSIFKNSVFGFCGVVSDSHEFCSDYSMLLTGKQSARDDCLAYVAEGSQSLFYIGGTHSEHGSAAVAERISAEFGAAQKESFSRFCKSLLPDIKIKSKSVMLDSMFNVFLPYQTYACRFLARSGAYQSGGAYGFRDQLQDCLMLMYTDPDTVRRHIFRACAHQYEQGDVMHWWHATTGSGIRSRCSDDFLFLPYVAAEFAEFTGDYSFFDVRIKYAVSEELPDNKQERYETPQKSAYAETVYQHCMRALTNGERFGAHSLSLMGSCDWNDGFSAVGAGGKGESVFTTMLYILAIRAFLPIMRRRGEGEAVEYFSELSQRLCKALDDFAYMDGQYIRAVDDSGYIIGKAGNEECEIDSLTQSFALFVFGVTERTSAGLERVYEKLYDRENKILKLFHPPFNKYNAGYISRYGAGLRENGGQYTHAAIWAMRAYLMAGRDDIGLQLLSALNPLLRCSNGEHYNNKNDRFKNEPFVMSADIYSGENAGRGGWSWYTGAAAWYWKVIMENVLGLRFTDNYSHLSAAPKIDFELTVRTELREINITAAAGGKLDCYVREGVSRIDIR